MENRASTSWATVRLRRRRADGGGTDALSAGERSAGTQGTAYRGRRCTRREFDHVASLRVEGVSISTTARVTGHARNTIARWLERASAAAERFNYRMVRDFDISELQADEFCTFIGSKSRTLWLFATIEVSSRLWAGSVLGRRSYRNTAAVLSGGDPPGTPYWSPADRHRWASSTTSGRLAAFSGQRASMVTCSRHGGTIVSSRLSAAVKIGTASRLKAALLESEDSETLNTPSSSASTSRFGKRLRPCRRCSPCHARGADQRRGHVELVRCHYNFVRPHSALRFGRETRTPARQAGRVSMRLALSTIFAACRLTLRVLVAVVETCAAELPRLSWPHEQRTAA